MAERTAVDEGAVKQASSKHQAMTEQMRSDLTNLRSKVQDTLAGSTSEQTKALESVYGNWFSQVETVILQECERMSSNMNVAADDQVTSDQSNSTALNAFLS